MGYVLRVRLAFILCRSSNIIICRTLYPLQRFQGCP
ncbi:hypothetical protein OIU78_029247 [Salix suchowensis]|nr:hypothetical protein OIU78_029247 [Salix suchowensis]